MNSSAGYVNAWTPSARLPRRTPPRPPSPDLDRADAIGEFWGHPESRTLSELPIDLEEDTWAGGHPRSAGLLSAAHLRNLAGGSR